MIWFDLVLWHINHCRLFQAKSFSYIYIKYIWFGLIWFYDISTIVVIYEGLYFDLAQGQMNGAPNETYQPL